MSIRPVQFRWKTVDICVEGGEVRRLPVMVPHTRFMQLCKRQFEEGEDYPLGPVEGVPSRSRAAFFASIHDAWNNLPAEDTRFPSDEHLRKVSLVRAGWAKHSQAVFDTEKDARKHALELRKVDEYAVIVRKGLVVDCWIAKSIASGTPGLDKQKFREIQTKALDWVATLARTTRAELEANAGTAAA